MKMSPDTSDPQRDRATFAAAVKLVAVFVAVALVIMLGAMAWMSGCKTGTGQGALHNCSGLQRNTLGAGPAVVLFIGAVARL